MFELDRRHSYARRLILEDNYVELEKLLTNDPELINAFNCLAMTICNYYNKQDMAMVLKKLGSEKDYNPKSWGK